MKNKYPTTSARNIAQAASRQKKIKRRNNSKEECKAIAVKFAELYPEQKFFAVCGFLIAFIVLAFILYEITMLVIHQTVITLVIAAILSVITFVSVKINNYGKKLANEK